MSTWQELTITCPRCAAQIRTRVAEGVHITRVAHVREEIVARRFHGFACGACRETIRVQKSFVYTDFGRKHWVLVALAAEVAAWPAWEAQLRGDVAHAFDRGSPLVHEIARGFQVRVVFGYEELREKLVVWDAGLDDALVECVKVRALAEDPGLAAPGSRLLVHRVDPDDRCHAHWYARAADPRPARALALPAEWTAAAVRDRASLATRFAELFGGGFVSVNRFAPAGAA